jgi:hypothetical protein
VHAEIGMRPERRAEHQWYSLEMPVDHNSTKYNNMIYLRSRALWWMFSGAAQRREKSALASPIFMFAI